MRLFIFLCGFLFATSSFAQQQNPTPDSILAEAAKGRIEMLLAMSDLERYAPQIPSGDELYSFLAIIDKLEVYRV